MTACSRGVFFPNRTHSICHRFLACPVFFPERPPFLFATGGSDRRMSPGQYPPLSPGWTMVLPIFFYGRAFPPLNVPQGFQRATISSCECGQLNFSPLRMRGPVLRAFRRPFWRRFLLQVSPSPRVILPCFPGTRGMTFGCFRFSQAFPLTARSFPRAGSLSSRRLNWSFPSRSAGQIPGGSFFPALRSFSRVERVLRV